MEEQGAGSKKQAGAWTSGIKQGARRSGNTKHMRAATTSIGESSSADRKVQKSLGYY